nr:response regulator [Gluconobacter cerinus]
MNDFRNESGEGKSLVPRLLFVDDDRDVQIAARLLFRRNGIEMLSAYGAEEALTQLASFPVDLVLLDLNYRKGESSGAEGLALLKDILVLRPDLPVIVVTGHSGVTIAVAAMRAGAADFVMKPWNNERLLALVGTTLKGRRADQAAETDPVMIVASEKLRRIVTEADRLAVTRAPLVITGPSGVGKMLLARRIHALSQEINPAVTIRAEDCEGLPEEGGTWIFRNFEALSAPMQRHLADRLDEPMPPRVMALSSMDHTGLEAALDPRLMLHLGMVILPLSPLHERPEDILALSGHFLRYFSVRHGLVEPVMDEERHQLLSREAWPQNVRSLRATVERAVLTGTWSWTSSNGQGGASKSTPTLRDTERSLIEATLRKHGFNVTQAARELGLTRPALYRRMARYGL